MTDALSFLPADAAVFCAWRSEPNASTGRLTKKPYRRINLLASSTDPTTWTTRATAENVAANPSFIAGATDGMCGIGLFLGDKITPDEVLFGIDVDTCITPTTGELARWALELLGAVPTYAEISPSGTGIKLFGRMTPAGAARVQAAMGGKSGKQWKLPGLDHPPGIELYLGGRYFAFTGKLWPGAPDETRIVQADDVLRVVDDIGPRLKPGAGAAKPNGKTRAKVNGAANGVHVEHDGGGGDSGDGGDAMAKLEAFAKADAKARRLLSGDLSDLGADKSASAVAWRLGGFCKDAGLSQADGRAVLRAYAHVDLRKYWDGDEGHRQLSRIWAKVRETDAATDDCEGDDPREPLEIRGSDLPKTAEKIVAVLSKSPSLYHRDGPVTVARDPLHGTWAAHPLTAHGVVREIHRTHRPFIWVKATKDEGGGFKKEFVTASERVALMSLDDKDGWRGLPALDGFASSPLLHEDGSIRTAVGYDPITRMFCTSAMDVAVPETPTTEEAKAALLKWRVFLRTFAFADAPKVEETFEDADGKTHVIDVVDLKQTARQDESAALHAAMTAICRPCLHLAPAFVATAPNLSGAGAGKGLFFRVICAAAFGIEPKSLPPGHDRDELDKRIASALMRAEQVLFLDNLNNRALHSDTLASAITERPAQLRVMGTSKLATVAAASFIAITGNGLTISEDMARRVLSVAMDPGIEDPEGRKFKSDVLAEAFDRRAELLAAALTIWRWGRQSGEVKAGRPMGSFGQWCRWVRDPLVTLGCADPAERIAQTKLHDPRRAAAAELFTKWNERHGDSPVAASDLHPDVKDIADPAGRGRQYLASRIRSFAGTRAAGFVLVHSPANGKWEPDKYVLKTTDTATTEGIGVVGGIGHAAAPMTPTPPMPPKAASAEIGADVQEGEF